MLAAGATVRNGVARGTTLAAGAAVRNGVARGTTVASPPPDTHISSDMKSSQLIIELISGFGTPGKSIDRDEPNGGGTAILASFRSLGVLYSFHTWNSKSQNLSKAPPAMSQTSSSTCTVFLGPATRRPYSVGALMYGTCC